MIPVCEPLLGGNEAKYVMDCLRTNWISSSGKYIKKLESAFSKYCGSKYGITTTSGTTALHLALAALGIEPGDEVIVPTFTIASTIFAILYCQGKPVFVDSESRGAIAFSGSLFAVVVFPLFFMSDMACLFL